MVRRVGRSARRNRLRREGGSAVALALMLLLVLSLGLAVLSESLVARMREAQREIASLRLGAACDAALADALAGLAESSGFPGVAPHLFAGAVIQSEVEWIALDQRTIRVRARYAGRERHAEANVVLDLTAGPRVVRWRRTG